jgi:hypothetical protein
VLASASREPGISMVLVLIIATTTSGFSVVLFAVVLEEPLLGLLHAVRRLMARLYREDPRVALESLEGIMQVLEFHALPAEWTK